MRAVLFGLYHDVFLIKSKVGCFFCGYGATKMSYVQLNFFFALLHVAWFDNFFQQSVVICGQQSNIVAIV